MALKLMYITKRPEIARIAERAGVDRIFVDMEYIGKADRQGGMDTVQSGHTLEDVANIKSAVKKAELLVRCNPIHNETSEYCSSEEEIDGIIQNGADVIMLPYFKTAEEVEKFVECVGGRAKTMLLFETPDAVKNVDEILKISGIDEVHIGLNDLSLGMGKKFMFELLIDGTVENLCCKVKEKGIPFGFGGVAAIGTGTLPAEKIITEHYRQGSSGVILSRSFCDCEKVESLDRIEEIFEKGIKEIRAFENSLLKKDIDFEGNFSETKKIIEGIISGMN